MKVLNKLTIILLFVLYVLSSCEKDKYFDIQKDSWFKMNLNDTVLFHSGNATDSFYISNIYTYYEDVDKTHYYEHLNINYEKTNKLLVDEIGSYSIYRKFNQANIYWKNLNSILSYSSFNPIKYTIESTEFENVYRIDNREGSSIDSGVRIVYYTDIYGIIAYELNNGDVYKINTSVKSRLN